MPLEQLVQLLRARPFQPFRLVMTDGTVYEVRHPELVIATAGRAFVGYPGPEPPVATRVDIVALLHVVRFEFIAQPSQAGAGLG